MSTMNPQQMPLDSAARRQALTVAIHRAVADGGRVEHEDEFGAVLRFGPERSQAADVLHLILILVTLGGWLLFYVPLAIVQRRQRRTVSLTVDELGQVHQRRI